jgi:hypothetical protein
MSEAVIIWLSLLALVSAVGLMTDFERIMGLHFCCLLLGVLSLGILSYSI